MKMARKEFAEMTEPILEICSMLAMHQDVDALFELTLSPSPPISIGVYAKRGNTTQTALFKDDKKKYAVRTDNKGVVLRISMIVN